LPAPYETNKKKEKVMKKSIRMAVVTMICFAFAVSVTSCASVQKNSGFLGDNYKKLEPGPEGTIKMRWIKPGYDFTKYNKVMLDSVVFYFAPDSEDKGIDANVMKELTDSFNTELVNALKDKYTIVNEPGPDVIRWRIALTGIKQSRPVISGFTSVMPPSLAANAVTKVATGSWIGSGATGAESMVLDSMTNEVIGLGQDEQTAGFTERFSKYGSANEAFKFWATRVRAIMDLVQTKK
jgi:hypothetical protein